MRVEVAENGVSRPDGAERRRVLVVSDLDLRFQLGRTLLWRSSIERILVSGADAALEACRERHPQLVVVDGRDHEAALVLVRRLRADAVARHTSIAVLSRCPTLGDESALREAGASVVLAGRVDAELWDARLEELLNVPRRRESRIPMHFLAWTRVASEAGPTEGLALNISVNGVLLESAAPLELGTKLEISFRLPGDARELHALGEVVRQAGASDARFRTGVKFLVLRDGARERIQQFVVAVGGSDVKAPFEQPSAEAAAWRAQLRASEARSAAILDSVLDCIITTDVEGRIVEFNRAAEQAFGHRRHEVLGRRVVDALVPPEFRNDPIGGFAHYFALGQPRLLGRHVETTAWRADGSAFPVELVVTAVQGDGVSFFTAALRDVTHERLLEEQYRQAQKMEAIGRLAGGVAHDFNNLLNVIVGYGDLVFRGLSGDSPLRAKVQQIQRAADRAAGLTRQLLAFSRKQVLQPKVLDPNRVVDDTVQMLGRMVGDDVEVVADLADDVESVKADPGQLEQVLMNLIVNARDAMPRGGKIAVRTRRLDLDEGRCWGVEQAPPGRYVLLEVQDDGLGMSPETQRHVFEPFFTTKESGTGLGLATVYGIVKQSDGFLDLETAPGRGTTFRIILPRVTPGASAAEPQITEAPKARATEAVLVVEDQDLLLSMVREALQLAGYRVLEARNGEEALRILAAEGGIDLLLTDLVMPGMSGAELARRAVAMQPLTKVLLMSGHTDDAVARRGIHDARTAFLRKPFTIDALERKVREVLEGGSARS